MSRLAQALGRIPMYRAASLGLAVLAALALVLAMTGVLALDPLGMLAVLCVTLLFTILGSALIARLFRTRAHLESSVITGLILFFLLPPTSEPARLGLIALGALIAAASKFVLAVRGRHVFNPAAVAAVVLTLTGWSPAVWWTGTPALAGPVALVGAIVLLRSGRLLLGTGFAALVVVLTTPAYMLYGLGLGDALWYAIGFSPVLFAAAFMVTEPLTLPPRSWQRWLVVAIVGVLFALPLLRFGGSAGFGVYLPPELAILVGNAVAFVFGARAGIDLEVTAARRIGQDAVELTFRPRRPLRHAGGQYLELSVPHRRADRRGTRRMFSLTSPPSSPEVSIAFRVPEPASSLKRQLAALRPGDRLRATGVWGDFVLPADPSVPLLLLASGIGLTPFLSQLRAEALVSRPRRDVVLLHVDGGAEPLFAEETAALPARFLRLSSLEDAHAQRLLAEVPDLRERTVYLAGSPEALRVLRRALRAAGARRVRTDAFAGY